MIEQRYTFPGGLGFQLETADPAAASFFEAEYGWARGGRGEPALTLRWHRARLFPGLPDAFKHSHKLLARWSYRVELDAGRIHLEVAGNRWALPMVHHMLVHHGLRYLAAHNGWLVLHAAALEWQGASVLLTGAGGAGKTTVSSLLLASGQVNWRQHADDYVFLEPAAGRSHAYPTRAHLYSDVLTWAPALADRLSRGERLKVHLLSALRRWSGDRIKWPTRVELKRLWPRRELADQARLGAVLILERGDVEAPRLAPVPTAEAVDRLMAMNFHEARHFVALMQKAGAWEEAGAALDQWRRRERQALATVLGQARVHRLLLPQTAPGGDPGSRLEAVALQALAAETGRS